MANRYRWGIVSTGHIAGVITADLLELTDSAVVGAVASRTQAKADEFADQFGIEQRFSSYQAMADDGELDVVYIASPHSDHLASTRLFLERGIAVLCEKPLTISRAETDELIKLAQEREVFLMEAVWTRTHPLIGKITELLANDAIGQVRHLSASFGFAGEFDDDHRLVDPAQGGGAILDLGVYPTHISNLICGAASEVAGTGSRHPRTGVDVDAAAVFRHQPDPTRPWVSPSGAQSVVRCSMTTDLGNRLEIGGSKGKLITDGFLKSTKLQLIRDQTDPEIFTDQHAGNGYQPQLLEVMRCLTERKTESGLVPLADTSAVADTLDRWMATVPK